MELHDHLYAIGLQTGREVFDDPERLRGVLASSGAPAGEVELVVDAVRRGAYRAMITALDGGADPARTVQDTGARLAQERGSDAASATWALAVLGFAVGRVGENDVRRARAAGPATPLGEAPTQRAQPSGPQAPPSYQPPPPAYGAPAGQPAYQQPGFGAPGPQPGQPPYGQQPYGQPFPQQGYQQGYPQQPAKKSRLPLILGVGGTLAAIIVAVVLALVLTGGDDDADTAGGDTDPTSQATAESPTDSPTQATSAPTSDPTTESAPATTGVSDEAAAGYTTALLAFSTDFGEAGEKLSTASTNDNLRQAKAAARDMRAAVYDLDLAVRDLDLAPVQPEVNLFLEESSTMISAFDEIEQTADSVLAVNGGVASLPITAYTDSFQTLADAIDASRR